MSKQLSVAIDVRLAHHTGIGRYIRGFVGALNNTPSASLKYHLIGPNAMQGDFPARFPYRSVRTPVYSLTEQITFPMNTSSFDCLHTPHYNAPLLRRKKLVVTIHDLIHLHFQNHLPSPFARAYAQWMLPRVVKKADAIIAVSEYTKNDLVKTLNVDPQKITVVHHGVDPSFLNLENQAREGGERYFLYVGLLKKHKNLGVLLDAFSHLKKKSAFGNLKLKLVGTPDLKQVEVREWLQRIKEDPDIFLASHISDLELKRHYQNAVALVSPSLCEGFGFPALEAMAMKTPVIASHATSIPEILGEQGGLYFDPNSSSELERCMEQVATDFTLRKRLIEESSTRLPLFDWKIAGKKTEQVYESVLGTN